jgi:hypothetical protein
MDERLQKAEMQKSIEELAKMGNIKRIGMISSLCQL